MARKLYWFNIMNVVQFTLNLLIYPVLFAGCATSPRRSEISILQQAPPTWTAGSDKPFDTDSIWWMHFDDPHLDAVIREALSANRDLKAAAARLDEAAADARISASGMYPSLQLGMNASQSKQSFNIPGLGGTDGKPISATIDSYGVSLESSWEADLWGRVRSASSAAIADFEAQVAQFRGATLSLSAQTAKAWFALTEAKQQLSLAQATVESYGETARRATDRVEAGLQSPTDQFLTAANLSSAEALQQQRLENFQRSVRQLEVLMGRYPSGILEAANELPLVPPLPAVGFPAELVNRRPDLVEAERRLASAVKRVDSSRASLYPRINFNSRFGGNSPSFGDILASDSLVWTIGGSLVQPLLMGGELRARVDASEAREKAAAEVFAQAVLNAFEEVETGLVVEEALAKRESAQISASFNAQKAQDIALNRYQEGVDSLLVVLEAQRRALDAQSAVITARRQLLENRINLHLALGGGFNELAISTTENES